MFLLLLSLFLFFLFIFPFLPARDDNTTTARKRRRRRIPPFGAITRKSFKPISAVTLRNEMDFQPTASPTLSGIPRAGCRSAKQRPLHVIYVLWQQHGYLAFWCFFPICVWTPFVPPLFFFDAMKWHQRCFHVIFNKNVYMYVCPTFSSIPCQTFISAFPPPSIIFSHITHVIQSKMTCSHWGEERRRGDKRWVLFSVLGEIPSFSRTDEEETNSTIHSLPFTKKKNIPDIIVSFAGGPNCCCCRHPASHYIHQPMSWLYTMLLRGAGWRE